MTNQDVSYEDVLSKADTVIGRFGCSRSDCCECAKYIFHEVKSLRERLEKAEARVRQLETNIDDMLKLQGLDKI